MLHIRSNNDLFLASKLCLDDYVSIQLNKLLTTCNCLYIGGKDYELDVANQVLNGLTGKNETADVYLYAAIERNDWDEVLNIYQTVFRPYIMQVATEKLTQVLCFKNNNKI